MIKRGDVIQMDRRCGARNGLKSGRVRNAYSSHPPQTHRLPALSACQLLLVTPPRLAEPGFASTWPPFSAATPHEDAAAEMARQHSRMAAAPPGGGAPPATEADRPIAAASGEAEGRRDPSAEATIGAPPPLLPPPRNSRSVIMDSKWQEKAGEQVRA